MKLYAINLSSLESGSYEIKVIQTLNVGDTIKETYQNTTACEVESSGFQILIIQTICLHTTANQGLTIIVFSKYFLIIGH